MKYFSIAEKSILELKNLQNKLRSILKEELKLTISKNFFFFNSEYYPINICFFKEDFYKKVTLGQFVPSSLKININWDYYFHLAPNDQTNLLRHELAHYFDYILRGDLLHAHDTHYRKLCLSFGWGEEVYLSKFEGIIECMEKKFKDKNKKINTYQKILSLSKNNPSWEEAQVSLLMAKRYLEKNQLESYDISNSHMDEKTDDYILIELASGKRINQKMQTLALLLENFHCKTIFKTRPGMFALEIVLKRHELDSICEIYHFFDKQIDRWFLEAKQYNASLHRKSFYMGIREGLESKFKSDHSINFPHLKALTIKENQKLNHAFSLLYPRHGKIKSINRLDQTSYSQGMLMGKRIELNTKISQRKNFLEYLF